MPCVGNRRGKNLNLTITNQLTPHLVRGGIRHHVTFVEPLHRRKVKKARCHSPTPSRCGPVKPSSPSPIKKDRIRTSLGTYYFRKRGNSWHAQNLHHQVARAKLRKRLSLTILRAIRDVTRRTNYGKQLASLAPPRRVPDGKPFVDPHSSF
ncbi:hypothetical protein LZ32DRAFT_100109 [Colletotrichum eremochloae]|nr:hypothetical protein LZ32DRAFT_100109 [Colletotrichum eremochloae]